MGAGNHMNIQFGKCEAVKNVALAALKGWHLSNPEKSIIGDQKSIISARLLVQESSQI